MTNEQEKSDLFVVAMKPGEQTLGDRARSRWSQGRGPRGTQAGNACAGLRAGKACPRGSPGYAELLVELRRSSPEVGARCVNYARRDLCGGCPVMGIPTAINMVLTEIDIRIWNPPCQSLSTNRANL